MRADFYERQTRSWAQFQRIAEWCVEHSGFGRRVLDAGGGGGEVLAGIAERRTLELGCVLDRSLRVGASCEDSDLHRVRGDLNHSFPFQPSVFDTVIAASVLHLLDDMTHFFSECSRVGGPGLTVYVLTCGRRDLKSRFLNRFWPRLESIDQERYPSEAEIRRAAKLAGLRSIWTGAVCLGEVIVDDAFAVSLANRPWSTLALLETSDLALGWSLFREWSAQHGDHVYLLQRTGMVFFRE